MKSCCCFQDTSVEQRGDRRSWPERFGCGTCWWRVGRGWGPCCSLGLRCLGRTHSGEANACGAPVCGSTGGCRSGAWWGLEHRREEATIAAVESLVAVGRPRRGEISETEGGQKRTEGTAAGEGPSVLYQKCQRERVCCGDRRDWSDPAGLDWSRLERAQQN